MKSGKLWVLLLACLLLGVVVGCVGSRDGGGSRGGGGSSSDDDDSAGDDDDSSGVDDDDVTSDDDDEDLPTATQRRVLHELFSGSNTGPSLGADERVLDVLHANEGAYVLLSYQIGTDPYVTTEGLQRRMSYLPSDAESYSIPWVQADGDNGFNPIEINNDEGYNQDNFDEFVAEPCALRLAVTHTVTDQTVDLEVTLTPLQDEPSEDLSLYVAIIEGTTYANVGNNGQTEFHHVMKKMLPDEGGRSIAPLVRGEVVTVSDSYTFQGDYDDDTSISNFVDHDEAHTVEEFDDLSVVVFVQDEGTRQVHQSAWSVP